MVSKPQIPEAAVRVGVWCPTSCAAGAWGKPCEVGPGFARPALPGTQAQAALPAAACLSGSACPASAPAERGCREKGRDG